MRHGGEPLVQVIGIQERMLHGPARRRGHSNGGGRRGVGTGQADQLLRRDLSRPRRRATRGAVLRLISVWGRFPASLYISRKRN